MVYYVDDQAETLSDLSESWRGRKLPGELISYLFKAEKIVKRLM